MWLALGNVVFSWVVVWGNNFMLWKGSIIQWWLIRYCCYIYIKQFYYFIILMIIGF